MPGCGAVLEAQCAVDGVRLRFEFYVFGYAHV
jgi:hypothetical protein